MEEQTQKHPGGRPTKYEDRFVEEVVKYLKTCGREQTKIPKRVDVALLLDVTEDTLNNWAKVHEEFLNVLIRVDMAQKAQLMDDGMYGGKEINPRIAQFLLTVNHGMVEKTNTDITSQGDKIELPRLYIPEEIKK